MRGSRIELWIIKVLEKLKKKVYLNNGSFCSYSIRFMILKHCKKKLHIVVVLFFSKILKHVVFIMYESGNRYDKKFEATYCDTDSSAQCNGNFEKHCHNATQLLKSSQEVVCVR